MTLAIPEAIRRERPAMNELVLDIETQKNENNSLHLRVVCIGIRVLNDEDGFSKDIEEGRQCYVIDHNIITDFSRRDKLIEMFENYHGRIIGHNLVHDIGVLQNSGFTFPHTEFFDTYIALRNINPWETRFGLKPWGIYLGMEPWWFDMRAWWDIGDTQDADVKELMEYNLGDLDANTLLYRYCLDKFSGLPGLWPTFQLENFLIPHVARMRSHGLGIDYEEIKRRQGDIEKELADLEQSVAKDYGPTNLRSHMQVARLLFDVLKLPQVENRSTKEDVLKTLQARSPHPFIDLMLKYREIEKQKSTFLDPIIGTKKKPALAVNGMLYTDLRIHGTDTTRFSSHNPNVQNYPQKLRVIFNPRNGMFMWYDMDQLEFKICMDVSGQQDVVEEIKKGGDAHDATARILFGSTDKEKRDLAKTTNYAKTYGAGIGKIMRTAGVSMEKAQELDWTYNQKMTRLMAYIKAVHDRIEKDLTVVSPFGNVWVFPYTFENADGQSYYRLISSAKREGFNRIIQSMGHLLLLLTWVYLINRLEEGGLLYNGVDFANEIHDELLMDIKPELVSQVGMLCHEALSKTNELCEKYFGYKFSLPITGTIKYGEKWQK